MVSPLMKVDKKFRVWAEEEARKLNSSMIHFTGQLADNRFVIKKSLEDLIVRKKKK